LAFFNIKDSENIDDYKCILIDAVIMLANTFQASWLQSSQTDWSRSANFFDKMLE